MVHEGRAKGGGRSDCISYIRIRMEIVMYST